MTHSESTPQNHESFDLTAIFPMPGAKVGESIDALQAEFAVKSMMACVANAISTNRETKPGVAE